MDDTKLLKRLFSDIGSSKKYLLAGVFLYIPVTLLTVIQPVVIGTAVQHALVNQQQQGIIIYAAIFFALVGVLGIAEFIQGICLQIAGQVLVKNLRQKAFLKVQKLPLGFLDSTPMGKLLTRLSNDAESVAELFSMGAIQIVGDFLFLGGTLIMLLIVDIRLSLYALIVTPVLGVGLYYFRYMVKKAYVRVREALSSLNGFTQEYLSGISSVQISGRLEKLHQDFYKHNQNNLSANRQAIFLDAAVYSFVDLLSYLAVALVLWGALDLKLDNALGLGVLVAFIEALSRFFQPLRELSNRYTVFQSALVSLDRIYDLLSWPEEDTGVKTKAGFKTSIVFDDVSFWYKKDEPVLKHVSFTVTKGQRIALVGQTGAGKSTAIKLLNRFYPVSQGSIIIDGLPINDISLSDLRHMMCVVPQEVFLFQGTVRDNLMFGNKNATDDMLWHALETVQLADSVRVRGGLMAAVEVRGQNWSLGERSLFALARALLLNPDILILDEATASIDVYTEQRLQKATERLLQNRTALVIAHRLSTIVNADQILVFHQGSIIEQGRHQELLSKKGLYAGLAKLKDF